MKLLALTTSLLLLVGFTAQAEILNCNGKNQNNGHDVVGTCADLSFNGHDTFNGHPVAGYCFSNGNLEAYDINTEDFVSGYCYKGLAPATKRLSYSDDKMNAEDETPDVAN